MSETNSEIEQLKAALALKEAEAQEALRLAQEERNKQADLRFSFAAEKNNVTDAEFVKYKLSQHLSSSDEATLNQFDINAWMGEMKTKHPIAFGSAPARPAATSGVPPAGARSVNYEAKVDTKPAPMKQLDSEWVKFKQEQGL